MGELCDKRAKRLRENKKPKSVEDVARDFVGHLKKGGPSGFHVELLLQTGMSALYAFLRQLGLVPGAEFQAALKEADRLNLKLVHGDRDIDVTLKKLASAVK